MVNSEFARLSDGLRRTRLALRDVIVAKLKAKFVNQSDDLAWWKQGVQPLFDADFLEKLRKVFNKQRKGGVIAGANEDPANLLEFNELRVFKTRRTSSWLVSKGRE